MVERSPLQIHEAGILDVVDRQLRVAFAEGFQRGDDLHPAAVIVPQDHPSPLSQQFQGDLRIIQHVFVIVGAVDEYEVDSAVIRGKIEFPGIPE